MKFSDGAKKVISALAPTLATALGGPLAGAAAAQIVKGLGGSEESADAALAAADPQTIIQLKQIEVDFQKFLSDNQIDLEKIHQEDRASARAREIAIHDETPRTLAYIYLALFLVTLSMQFYIIIAHITIDAGALRVLDGLTAILGTLVTGSKDYYFGSSIGSKQKTGILGQK